MINVNDKTKIKYGNITWDQKPSTETDVIRTKRLMLNHFHNITISYIELKLKCYNHQHAYIID